MNVPSITPAQAEQLGKHVKRQLRYLNRLCERLQSLGFVPNDPLYEAALNAQAGVHHLSVACHYETCTSGVGRD